MTQVEQTAPPTPAVPAATGSASRFRSTARLLLPWALLLLVLLLALVAPLLAPYEPTRVVGRTQQPPSSAHLFGTDSVGMDVFSRVLAGAGYSVRIAIVVAALGTVLGLAIGTFVGLAESTRGPVGALGRGVNTFSEYVLAIPHLVVGIVVVGVMGASWGALVVALTVGLMQAPIRLTRTEVLRVRAEPYLDAAELSGESRTGAALRHVLPNAMGPALVHMPLVFGNAILLLASLGFIGVGTQPPTPEWGAMLSTGVSSVMLGYWWGSVFPAAALFLTVFGVAIAARGIRSGLPDLMRRVRRRTVRR